MQTKIKLPFKILNKILIIRPSHPILKILRDYLNDHLDNYGSRNII